MAIWNEDYQATYNPASSPERGDTGKTTALFAGIIAILAIFGLGEAAAHGWLGDDAQGAMQGPPDAYHLIPGTGQDGDDKNPL